MVVGQVANIPQIREKFSTGDKFQDEVEVSGVLTESFHINLAYQTALTMNGWLIMLSIWF